MSIRNDLMFKRQPPTQEFSPIIDRYGYYFDEKNGERLFGVIGQKDIQADIQSELAGCDYQLIMRGLNPSISDFDTDMLDDILEGIPPIDPKDPLSAIAMRENLKIAYDKMPAEVKARYGNNKYLFANSIVNGEFADYFDSLKQSADEASKVDTVNFNELVEELGQLRTKVAELGGNPSDNNQSDGGNK